MDKVEKFKELLREMTRIASKTDRIEDKDSNEFYNGCGDVYYKQEELIKMYEEEVNKNGINK